MKSYVAHEQIGYYCKDVRVVVDYPLKYCPYGQCGVAWNYQTRNYELYSYSSLICTYNVETGMLEWGFDALPDYSRTTTKHFSAFLREYCPNYSYHQWKEDHYKSGCSGTNVGRP